MSAQSPRPTLRGLLADPKNAAIFRTELVAEMKGQAADLAAEVNARAPVAKKDRGKDHKAGTLKKSLKVAVYSGKRTGKITLAVTSDARNEKSGFPYGAAVERDTGFIDDAVDAQASAIVEGVQAAAQRAVDMINAGGPAGALAV